jgi:hypothetical protein
MTLQRIFELKKVRKRWGNVINVELHNIYPLKILGKMMISRAFSILIKIRVS